MKICRTKIEPKETFKQKICNTLVKLNKPNNISMRLIILLTLVCLIFGCAGKDEQSFLTNINTMIQKTDLYTLKGKKVYFAHQSVGNNIVQGLSSLIEKSEDIKFIKIVTLEDYLKDNYEHNDSFFYFIHSRIGQNGHPDIKLNDFLQKCDSLPDIDAAFIKLCYADVRHETDVQVLYKNYVETLSQLQKKHQQAKFIYFTVPYTTKEGYFKGTLKKVMGKHDNNIARNKLNTLIRQTNNIDIFDIGFYESHLESDNTELEKEYLLKEYTYDNGHLNPPAAERISWYLIDYINTLLKNGQN